MLTWFALTFKTSFFFLLISTPFIALPEATQRNPLILYAEIVQLSWHDVYPSAIGAFILIIWTLHLPLGRLQVELVISFKRLSSSKL